MTALKILWGCASFLAKTFALLAASAVSWGLLAWMISLRYPTDLVMAGQVIASLFFAMTALCFIGFVLEAVGGRGVAASFLESLTLFCVAPFLVPIGIAAVAAWHRFSDAKAERTPSVIVVPQEGSAGQSDDGLDAAETLMDSWRGR